MVWRSVVISNPAQLRRERAALVVEQEQRASVPFEDIAVIVLNHREINLTHPVLSACAEHGISLFSTGADHQPSGVFVPFLAHSRSTRMLRLQLDIGRPLAKRAWARLVREKISNQAQCLRLSGRGDAERLDSYARRVRTGDGDNLEAQASAYYFPQLFGKGFRRSDNDWINAALNYGYAILRGAVTRALVAHGLHPSIGIGHANEQNAFNLADDLIEPFRPVVDIHVAAQPDCTPGDERDLSTADKAGLVALLNVDLRMPRGNMTVLAAIEQAAESVQRLFDGGASEAVLELPVLIGLQSHRFDM